MSGGTRRFHLSLRIEPVAKGNDSQNLKPAGNGGQEIVEVKAKHSRHISWKVHIHITGCRAYDGNDYPKHRPTFHTNRVNSLAHFGREFSLKPVDFRGI